MSERIHKVLARAGLGSRRAVERLLADGAIRVNGEVAAVGTALDRNDRVQVQGRYYRVVTRPAGRARWLRYHKPEGQVSTRSDPEGRPTVFDPLPRLREAGGRWVSLGRLDVNTSGLMLFTDDGALANALTHPSAGIEREYAVRVRGPLDDETLERLTTGVLLDDGEAKFDRIMDAGGQGANHWYHVILHEGRRNEVRRIWEAVGCQVARLTRVRFGPITLPRHIRPGRFEDLPAEDVRALQDLAGVGAGSGELALEPESSRGKRAARARGKGKPRKSRTRAGTGATDTWGRKRR